MKKVLVTGGSGFIGGHIAQELESRGYDVFIQDIHTPAFSFQGEYVAGDLLSGIKLHTVDFGAIFHCAGILGTSKLFDNIVEAEQINVIGSIKVFQWALDNPSIIVIHPNLLGQWLNPYMLSKNQAERYGWMFAQEYDMKYTSIKPTDVYGPRQSWAQGKASADFISSALKDEVLRIHGDGTAWVNYIFVKDVARLMVNAYEKKAVGKTLLLSHPDNDMGVEQFARMIIKQTSSSSEIGYVPMRRGQPYICNRIEHDCTETWKYIDPRSLTPLGLGLVKTIAWYRGLM